MASETKKVNENWTQDIAKVNTVPVANIATISEVDWVETGIPATVTYIGNNVDTTDGTAFTFANEPIGDAAADRYVICIVGARSENDSNALTLSGPEIGGSAATIIDQTYRAPSATRRVGVAMFGLLVAAGTTANIHCDWSQTVRGCSLAVYTITGISSVTPDATNTSATSSTTSTLSLNVLDGNVIIAGDAHHSGPNESTWTGVTEDCDILIEAGASGLSSGCHTAALDETPRTITCVGSNTERAGVSAVWSS